MSWIQQTIWQSQRHGSYEEIEFFLILYGSVSCVLHSKTTLVFISSQLFYCQLTVLPRKPILVITHVSSWLSLFSVPLLPRKPTLSTVVISGTSADWFNRIERSWWEIAVPIVMPGYPVPGDHHPAPALMVQAEISSLHAVHSDSVRNRVWDAADEYENLTDVKSDEEPFVEVGVVSYLYGLGD